MAPAVLDGLLDPPEALGGDAVEILVLAEADRLARLSPGVEQRIEASAPAHIDLARAAAIGVLTLAPGLAPLEIGQHLPIGPALGALVARPAVVVAPVAARIGHDIDGMGAAQHLAAHGLDGAIVEAGVGLGVIAPVMEPVLVHLAHAHGDMDQRVDVAPARLHDQHAVGARGAQAIGEHAASRSRANDDIVEAAFRGHGFPLESSKCDADVRMIGP